ncbi:MAG: hypothetical protein KatS3mg059_0180 [Thermomicrobiales bacterium]|nr:MAG: hypothetical protein KatS3mg059_0180 [Thermomicrobiales bacterium]
MPENPPVWLGSGKGFGMAEVHSAGEGRRTPLYDRHIALGARMIQFAGWIMPVQYSGIINEHMAVRTRAGLFDLGHMGQVDVAGPDAEAFLQYVTTNDVSALKPGQAQYSLLPNEQGGVVDDIIVYRRPSGVGYMVVVNAANRDKDVTWLHPAPRRALRPLAVELKDISDETGMIAIQGPLAEQITQNARRRRLVGHCRFLVAQGHDRRRRGDDRAHGIHRRGRVRDLYRHWRHYPCLGCAL